MTTLPSTAQTDGLASNSVSSAETLPVAAMQASYSPRRNRPGTKEEDAYQWQECLFEEIQSPLALQEHLQELMRVDRSDMNRLLQLPEGQDEHVWQYEHLRMLCLDLNYLVIQLAPECSKETCPEMKADEWLYLCAAHTQPQACCAIDYAYHTLDGATSLLNSNKYFPHRNSILPSSVKHFQSIARRLYRIFAHAWYHHREVFFSFESESYLYERFLAVSRRYKLIPESLLIIPEASLSSGNASSPSSSPSMGSRSLLQPPPLLPNAS